VAPVVVHHVTKRAMVLQDQDINRTPTWRDSRIGKASSLNPAWEWSEEKCDFFGGRD
jgi:hypothetical protein